MKKITLAAIILFFIITAVIGGLAVLFPPVRSNHQTANVNISNGSSRTYTLHDIAQHSTTGDCYLIVKGAVYDVSTYVSVHPGGKNSIVNRCGQEVTNLFTRIHSNLAWDLLGKYYVGEISNSTNQDTSTAAAQTTQDAFVAISEALLQEYPGAEIIQTKPAHQNYITKLIYRAALYEVHTDVQGILPSTLC